MDNHQNLDKSRQSGIELLRIIAIFMVLAGHANARVLGLPSPSDFVSSTSSSVMRMLFSSVVVGGVDNFVMISGWFGIHAKPRGLAKLLFEVFFLLWGIYAVFLLTGNATLNAHDIKVCLTLTDEYWFVMAYIGLYVLSPVLNAFVENATKREFQMVLAAFYVFQCYFCWVSGALDYFSGYSVTFFCGLYLTARYFRLYPVKVIASNGAAVYFACLLIVTMVSIVAMARFGNGARMLRYDNPLVIMSSLGLLSSFARMRFHSCVVNSLATACFAVYIIHFDPLLFHYFAMAVRWIYQSTSGLLAVAGIGAFLVAVFLACWLVDRVRLWVSRKIFIPKSLQR